MAGGDDPARRGPKVTEARIPRGPGVRVLDVGLNGVLFNETETTRTFKIEALSSAEPVEQLIYVAGNVETRSTLQNAYASLQPILVKVKPKAAQTASAKSASDAQRSSAPK